MKAEIASELIKPCPIYYPDIKTPLRIDIKKALKIQRILVKECSDRFKYLGEYFTIKKPL